MNLEMLSSQIKNQFADPEQVKENNFLDWKKNSPLLYDTLINHVLDWPSLTTQFLPLRDIDPETNYDRFKIIYGTQSESEVPDYLVVANVKLN